MSANQRHRLATETEEERAVRLQQMRDRLASETEEERAGRLQQMSANQHHRLAAESGSEREARLQRNREGQRGQQSQLPLFEQPAVPHQPLCTRLRIHRIRAHARHHNALHSPSYIHRCILQI